MRNFSLVFLYLSVVVLSAGCPPICPFGQTPIGDVCVPTMTMEDGGVRDSGTDAGRDSGTDAGRDLGTDLGSDLGTDLGSGGGPDAGACTWACDVTSVKTGFQLGCALLSTGRVACWGDNTYGGHGAGSFGTNTTPEYVDGIPAALEIAVGNAHACARTADGVWCWGGNSLGQVDPRSTTTQFAVARMIHGPVRKLVAGKFHTCVVDSADDAFCWGSNAQGQFGNLSTTTSSLAVTPVNLTFNADTLWAGDDRTCYRNRTTQRTLCAGRSIGSTPTEPPTIAGRQFSAVSISTGNDDACGIEAGTNVIYCWGLDVGQFPPSGSTTTTLSVSQFLSARTTASVVTFAGAGDIGEGGFYGPLSALTNVSSIAMDSVHGCYVRLGRVYCWGNNDYGKLGDGSTVSSLTPIELPTPTE